MNPLVRDWIAGLSSDELSAFADARFKELRELDHGGEAARRELAAAGVPEHRIRALYPFGLGAIADSLLPDLAISPEFNLERFTSELNEAHHCIELVGWNVSGGSGIDLDLDAAAHGTQLAVLIGHINSSMIERGWGTRELQATRAVKVLRDAIFLMNHLREVEAAARDPYTSAGRAQKALLRVTDLLLPHMRMQEMVSAAVAQWQQDNSVWTGRSW